MGVLAFLFCITNWFGFGCEGSDCFCDYYCYFGAFYDCVFSVPDCV